MGKKRRTPNTIIIIIALIAVACVMTWIIPAGEYVRVENELGKKIIDPTQFNYVDRVPVSLLSIPQYIVGGYKKSLALFLCLIFSGGCFQFVNKSGALQSLVAKVAKKYSDKVWIFIPILTTMFTLICTVKAVNTFIPFAPIFVLIARALGLDSIIGVAIILLGGSIGFSTGTLMDSTTLYAQQLADVPLYSGLWYRAISLVVYAVFTNYFMVRYATKIKKNPELSYTYDLDRMSGEKYDEKSLEEFGPMTKLKWTVLAILIATIVILVGGAIKFGWGMEEMAAGYIWSSAAMAIAMKINPNDAVTEFFNGVRGMVFAASITCIAQAIGAVLTAGMIIDTIVHVLAQVITYVPAFLYGPAMFLVNIIINVFVTSGSGQAAIVIPIVTPLAEMIGMTKQTAILAFNFGDGFCNMLLPTSSSLMGILSMGKVPYDRWMKFMWRLFPIWYVVGSVLLMIAHAIHLGPV